MAVVNEAWVSRRDDLWLFAAPPLALLLLGGCDGVEEVLRSHQIAVPPPLGLTLDIVFHALFVLAAIGCTATVCAAVVRSTPQPRLFRFALAPAAVATLAMATTLRAAAVWVVRARSAAPDRLGQSPLTIGLVLLLVLILVLIDGGVRWACSRGAGARAVELGLSSCPRERDEGKVSG